MKRVLLLLLLASCGNLKQGNSEIGIYPELTEKTEKLTGGRLNKNVILDGEKEEHSFEMNRKAWVKEMGFIEEISPNKAEYVGAFDEEQRGNLLLLRLKNGEQGNLKSIAFQKDTNGDLIKVEAVFHEDKDVYIHHRDITVLLKNDQIYSYTIDGYQKILLKDTIRFTIEGLITTN